MTAKQQVYSCRVCGQIVAVVHQGGGRLVCCGQPMMLAGDAGTGFAEAGAGDGAALAVQQVSLRPAGGAATRDVSVVPRALSVHGRDVLHTGVRVCRDG
jgi:desulfoferrodoxin-like iron-binding protein